MTKLSFVYDDGLILSLASLTTKDAVSVTGKIDAAREHGFRVVKTEGWFFLKGGIVNEFAVVGMAPSTLTAAEIEEGIEADPQSSFEVPETEEAGRPTFPLAAIGGAAAQANQIIPFKNAIPWSYPEGSSMIWWAYNPDDNSWTANSQELIIFAKHTGVWLRD